MEEIGVIVKQNEPTRWVNSMVTVIKPNGKLRICIDPRDLNQAILREHFPLKTVEEVISDMPNAKVFSLLDARGVTIHRFSIFNHRLLQIESCARVSIPISSP